MKNLGSLQYKYYENNFNLIRFMAACLVMYSHSFALAISPDAEPLRDYIGMTLGKVSVDIFFVISGFLLVKSIYSKNDVLEYFVARSLRIFPLLILVVLFTALVLSPALSAFGFVEYFNFEVVKYILLNSTLIIGLKDDLPGVFTNNPFPNAINGSLWTLPYEIRMYAILAGLWFLSRYVKSNLSKLFIPTVAALALFGYNFGILSYTPGDPGLRLCWMFFLGGTLYLYREIIPTVSPFYSVTLLAISFFFYPELFEALHLIVTPYLVVYFGLSKTRFICKFNRFGDGSYGIYIFAFPVQQTFVYTGVEDPLYLFFCTSLVVIPLAYLSWWYFESKIMKLKVPIYNFMLSSCMIKNNDKIK